MSRNIMQPDRATRDTTTRGTTRRQRFSAFALRHRPLSKIVVLALVVAVLVSRDPAFQATATIALIWTLWATSLNVVWGVAGQFSMAQVALGGVAAYTYAILAPPSGWGVLGTILCGIAAAVVSSALVGYLCLRLSGFRFAIMTLAFALAGVGLASSLEITGRSSGISVQADWPTIPLGVIDWDLDGSEGGFSLTLLLVVAGVLLALSGLLRSRLGRGLIALRDDEILAESIGLNTRNLRITAFMLGAVVAGIAGVMQAQSYRFIYPSLFSFDTLVNMIVVLVLGGRGRVAGAVVGGVIYSILTTNLSFGGNFEAAVFGVLVILIVIFAQNGVSYYLGLLESWISRGFTRTPQHTDVVDDDREDAGPVVPSAPLAEPERVAPVSFERDHPALTVEGVTKSFGGVYAVRDVSFALHRGEIVGVIGPNGAGKTTLFNLLSGFMAPDTGTIRQGERNVTRLPVHRRVKHGLVRTFQQPRGFGTQSARVNVAIAAERGSAAGSERSSVDEVLAAYGLSEVADRPSADLSYGSAKRLGVAMASAARPDVLLLDEPAAGLNASDIEILREDLVALRASGVAVCIVEHHMDLVMALCDRLVVLDAGAVIATGTPSEVSADPRVIEAYLGGVDEHA